MSYKKIDLVSVIIPYFKNKKYIKNSITSVINQTYKNLQIIIIFDENTKENLNFIKKISKIDKRIELLVNKKILVLVIQEIEESSMQQENI